MNACMSCSKAAANTELTAIHHNDSETNPGMGSFLNVEILLPPKLVQDDGAAGSHRRDWGTVAILLEI